MNLNRIVCIMRARWWLIVTVAVLAAVAGFVVTHVRNDSIRRTYIATAPVEFLQLESESDEEFQRRLATAAVEAETVRVSLGLGSNAELDIEADPQSGRLLFRATDRTAELAEEFAISLRDAYLEDEPSNTVIETIRARMASLAQRIDELEQQKEAQANGNPEIEPDPEVERQRTFLVIQQTALRKRSEDLTVQLTLSEFDDNIDRVEVEAELAEVDVRLAEVEDELAALPEPPAIPEPTITDTLDGIVLDTIISNLQNEYVTLSLRLLEESEQSALSDQVVVVNQTPPFRSRFATAAAAGAGAMMAALLTLLVLDQLRGAVWTPDDIEEVEVLGSVPRRPRRSDPDAPWYVTTPSNRRRRNLQAVRAGLDRAMAAGPTTLLLTGIRTKPNDVHELAADLAASIGVAGRQVLLVDADFDNPSDLPEYREGTVQLSTILAGSNGQVGSGEDIHRYLATLPIVSDRVRALSTGSGLADPADVMAGHQFNTMMEQAKQFVDVVVVAAPPMHHPVTDVLTQRLDHVIVAVREGRSTLSLLEDAERELQSRRTTFLGVIVIARSRARLRKRTETSPPPAAGSDEPDLTTTTAEV